MKQNELALATKLSEATISKILSGKRRPSWRVAKDLARQTGTDPKIWMEDDVEAKKKAIEAAQ